MMAASVKKIFSRSVVIIGIALFVAFGGLHLWLRYNAADFLEDIVSQRSRGKLKLKVKRLHFNYFTNYIEVKEGSLITGDTLSHPATYNIRLKKLALHVGSFWPLLTEQKLLLDSVKIYEPVVDVFRWRKDTTSIFTQNDVSIPQELGRMYNSLLDGLEAFGIKRIVIENGHFRFNNKMKPGSKPIVLSNINFHLVRMADGTGKRDVFVQDKQSVELNTANQNITMPGGRHQLAFKNFHLELFQKRIVLDSCTLTAFPSDASKNSFRIFFSKLLLIGVDFDAMYRRNLIRADSVYCIEPMIHFVLGRPDEAKSTHVKARPNPEKIIRDLTGDLDLAFVGVKDAGIRIDIKGQQSRSLFNSRKDDFEMHKLRISPDSSVPVTVQQFDLLVRDYRLYNKDSSTAFGFDSVHFSNNKIVLSNFSVVTTPSRYGPHNYRDFLIPHFELAGLDWYELIFEENLLAREATLYDPVIYYKGSSINTPRKRASLFQILKNADTLLTLERINVINGKLNLQLSSGTSFQLENASLSLNSNKLLASKNNEGLKQAIDILSFSTGTFHIKDITAKLDSVRYTGKNLITAKSLQITDHNKNVDITAGNVLLNNLLLDQKSQSVIIDGLSWQYADLKLKAAGGRKGSGEGNGQMAINNISGYNTSFSYSDGNTRISTNLQSLQANCFSQAENNLPHIDGLKLSGNRLFLDNGSLLVKAERYQIADKALSHLYRVEVNKSGERDSFQLLLPKADLSVNINSILEKNIQIKSLQLYSPDISFNKWKQNGTQPVSKDNKLQIQIGQLTAIEPSLHTIIHKSDSTVLFDIPRSEDGYIKMTDLRMNPDELSIDKLSLKNKAVTFTNPNGEILGVEEGSVDLELSDIHFSNKREKPNWGALLSKLNLQNPASFTTSKRNRFLFQQANVGNLQLSSDAITDFNKLLRLNVSAWVRTTTGQYVDSNTTIKWFNANYNSNEKELTLDSFVSHPTQPRDSVIAATPYQTDYKTFQSGPVKFTGFDLESFNKDSTFLATAISLQRPQITVYRDKRPPFRGGFVRPLPVDLIKKIEHPVSIGRISLVNGFLTYTELNPKTNKEGTIALTNMNASLSNITNRNLQQNDSLSLSMDAMLMDSAQISLRVKEAYADTLSGFLMTLRMKPTSSLSFLNPVVMPLSNIKITSGTIDSFHLRAIGNEYVSLGQMNMFYHNLKIKLLKGGEDTDRSVIRNTASFLANTFIIKKNNNGRSSVVYFERLRDRSFFNYIVKMAFSGMGSSVGIKNNKKYLHQYKKELEQSNLPPIRFDDALEKTLENKAGKQERDTKLGARNNN